MKAKLLPILFFLFIPVSGYLHAASPEKVKMHTSEGDLYFELFPEVAPKTVEQFLKLVRLGVYDGTHFFRLEPGFVLQVSTSDTKVPPLTPEQRAAIHRIPGEFNQVPHQAGILSMARFDDPDSAETSFSILLGRAPHLDNKYTVFGRVESGMEAIRRLEKTPVNGNAPQIRLNIDKVEVIESSKKMSGSALAALILVHVIVLGGVYRFVRKRTNA